MSIIALERSMEIIKCVDCVHLSMVSDANCCNIALMLDPLMGGCVLQAIKHCNQNPI
jgi:hypothetical protein